MYDLPHSAADSARRASERQIENYKAQQAEKRTQQRHEENLKAQRDLVESNKQVADEVHGIRDSLQEQISDNRKNIEANKLTEEKHDKRNKWQFGISIGVSIISALAALGMFLYTISK